MCDSKNFPCGERVSGVSHRSEESAAGTDTCTGWSQTRHASNRVWGHKAAYPVPTSDPRYIGLCMPLDLNLLLNTVGHWDKPEGVDDFIYDVPTKDTQNTTLRKKSDPSPSNEQDMATVKNSSGTEENEKGVNIEDKDKWREAKEGEMLSRLETVKEESFNSGDCSNSLQSVSRSTAVDSCCTQTTTALATSTSGQSDGSLSKSSSSEIGLTFHSKETCVGCFSLSQRQEIAQPTEQMFGNSATASSLLPGLGPPNLDEASSRPQTPVDRWEALAGISGCGGREGRVLVRKEVIRYVTNMGNIVVAKASESGLLSIIHG